MILHYWEVVFNMHFGAVTNTMQFDNKRSAKRTYAKNLEIAGQYTQLIVDGQAYNTASARKYFGMDVKRRNSYEPKTI